MHSLQGVLASLTPLTPSYPYPFPPASSTKRADTLLLKHALVDLLPKPVGEIYWTLLCRLLTGRTTREEFDLEWDNQLAGNLDDVTLGKFEVLHNSLLLSILYNTSKTTLPPANASHQGWTSKRKRGEAAMLLEEGADPLGELARKRRKLKRLVGSMPKVEKKRLKLLQSLEKDRDKGGTLGAGAVSTLGPGGSSTARPLSKPGLLMPPSAGLKTPSSSRFLWLCC